MHIDELEIYFQTFGYVDYDIEIQPGVTVPANCAEKFVNNTILSLRSHPGNQRFKPYYMQLLKYYQIVKWGK
ncbi:unnamed protein product [marine sediment metagenome]|uniref:DUF6965 domain-containing protein n=1 Tax=marine sediment metagenome TaxID=412755 RepID=X0WC81_9ZZZZ